MDLQALLAQMGGGGQTRPLLLNPGPALAGLPSGGMTAPQTAMPQANMQMPHPMQPGPQAPNMAQQMVAQTLSAPPPQQAQQQGPDMGSLMQMHQMQQMKNAMDPLAPVNVTASPVTGQGGDGLNFLSKLFGGSGAGSGWLGTGGGGLQRMMGRF